MPLMVCSTGDKLTLRELTSVEMFVNGLFQMGAHVINCRINRTYWYADISVGCYNQDGCQRRPFLACQILC
jgi:hypothetical protein